MRQLFFLGLMLGLVAAPSLAADLGGTPGPVGKVGFRGPSRPAFDREGGETLETAVPIPSLPFVDNGATCDNVNDYDIP